MANSNYSGVVDAVMAQDSAETAAPTASSEAAASASMTLPTGGIRTAFHTGAPQQAPVAAPTKAPVPAPASAAFTQAPSAEAALAMAQAQAPALAMAQAPAPKKQKPEPTPVSTFPAVAAQRPPAAANTVPQALTHPGQFLPQQTLAVSQSGVSLPVGVGIRLGGIGGIAPATAQTAVRAPGVQGQLVWGATNGDRSDQQAAERRQRNREHAKRSRVRKKFMLESLQGEVRELQRENQRLRMLVQEHVPEQAVKIISECCSTSPLFSDEDPNSAKKSTTTQQQRKPESLVGADYRLMQSLAMGQQCFVLSDPKLPDNPIVFASPGFYKLTGYTSKEVLGRNCRFLQGPGTNQKHVDLIRKAIETGSDATVCLLNYKADGTPFWNQFFIGALRDSDNCIVNYVS